MTFLLTIFHVLICIALIVIVLLQTGKGADMGAVFGGGGSQTLFGSTGASTFLTKATSVVAVVFMVTCLSLAYISSHQTSSKSIMQGVKTPIERKVDTATANHANAHADTAQTPAGSGAANTK